MGGDYSRFSHKPRNSYSGVMKQQGRVGLDADWNEAAEIQDRRWRSETIDIMGRCVVPESTPEAFSITPIDTLNGLIFSIGPGRMYVDGLQIECFGATPDPFDPALAEEYGSGPLPANRQPFLRGSRGLLFGKKKGKTDLIYVEAWQREVTAREDPQIKEVALGGADTATRLQTVWQVKALPLGQGQQGLRCGDHIPKWDDMIRPSGGRLTVEAVGTPKADDPCVLPPSGGYRGLENRLYRVEIHAYDAQGQATIKWDRDNASLSAAIDPQSAKSGGVLLTLADLGPDGISRFEPGDWIEILHYSVEFGIVDDHPEERLAKISSVHPESRQIELDRPVPALPRAHHPRVRRWKGVVQLTFPTQDNVTLEDDIQVGLSLAPGGAGFKPGDYWVFAARTANGSVEPLKEAPPRGIHRHYGRLALVTWGEDAATTAVVSCRTLWPRQACCQITVRPGEDVQAAIDRVPADLGGCVCLLPGEHIVTAPLSIDGRKHLILKGVGPASKLLASIPSPSKDVGLLTIDNNSEDIRIHDLAMKAETMDCLILIAGSRKVMLERLVLSNNNTWGGASCIGLGVCSEMIAIKDSTLSGSIAITQESVGENEEPLRGIDVVGCSLSDIYNGIDLRNACGGRVIKNRIQSADANKRKPELAFSSSLLESFEIADNKFVSTRGIEITYSRAVSVSRNRFIVHDRAIATVVSLQLRISENEIVLSAADAPPTTPKSLEDYLADRYYTPDHLAIEALHAWGLTVRDNRIEAPTGIGLLRIVNQFGAPLGGYGFISKTSLLRILGMDQLWSVAVKLGWILLNILKGKLPVVEDWMNEGQKIDTESKLDNWLFGYLQTALRDIPSFIGKSTIADNQLVVGRFGVLFEQILTIGGIRISNNRVSGFSDAGIRVHPWRSLTIVDQYAYWLRCAVIWITALLQALKERLTAVSSKSGAHEFQWQLDLSSLREVLTNLDLPGFAIEEHLNVIDMDWVAEIIQFCAGVSGDDEGIQALITAIEALLVDWDADRLDDLTNQDYVIDNNALTGSGDGIWLAIDGGRVSDNKVDIYPDNPVALDVVGLGLCGLSNQPLA